MNSKEITLNGRTFEVRESLGDPNCFVLTYGDYVVLDDSACGDFYGDIDEVADRMAAYIEEENSKQFPWYTLPTTWVVTDGECEMIDDEKTALRYAEDFNNGTAQEVTDREEFLAAKKKLEFDDDCWKVSRIFSFAYEYGKRGYFCRENYDVSYIYDEELRAKDTLEEELKKTGYRYSDNEDGSFDVCYDHNQDSFFSPLHGYHVATVKEDDEHWYVDNNCGAGWGEYSKKDWTLERAIYDQCIDDHIN